ncbi:Transposase type 1, partial [Trinorchestia longiramus]
DSVSERTVQKWFAKFRAGDCSLIDKERSGRQSTTDDDQIKSLIENNPHSTTRELAESLNLSKSAVDEHLVKLGIVTGDEKWIIYRNVQRKQSWSKRHEPPLAIPKVDLHPKEVMLCVWWDWKGILYYELLPSNQSINSEKYCSQLDDLEAAIREKRPELANRKGVVFQH